MVIENGGDPGAVETVEYDDTFGESMMEAFDLMTATDVVRNMYNKFPEIEFVNERDSVGGNVLLIFQIPKGFMDKLEELTDWLESHGIDVSFSGQYLKISVPEDEVDESLRTKLFKKIGCYSDGSPMNESLQDTTFKEWFDKNLTTSFDEYVQEFPEVQVLADAKAEEIRDNAYQFYDVYPVDSTDREYAFDFASEILGIPYDDLYNSWLNDEPLDDDYEGYEWDDDVDESLTEAYDKQYKQIMRFLDNNHIKRDESPWSWGLDFFPYKDEPGLYETIYYDPDLGWCIDPHRKGESDKCFKTFDEFVRYFNKAYGLHSMEESLTEGANGSVEDYLEKMKKGNPEKVLQNAKGNPNAEKAYKKFKGLEESLTEGALSNGSYSLYNGWVKVPDKDTIPDEYPDLEPEYSE